MFGLPILFLLGLIALGDWLNAAYGGTVAVWVVVPLLIAGLSYVAGLAIIDLQENTQSKGATANAKPKKR